MSKILIVEDEETIAELEKDYLELSGFEVEIETDGTKGLERALAEAGRSKVCIPTVFTAAPAVLKEFEKTPYAARLKKTGVITSYICPLMYMNNPLCGKMPVITSSNKLRTYTTARYYTDDEILVQITKGGARA